MSSILQYFKDLITERWNKSNRIQKLKQKTHAIDKIPLSTFFLNTFMFSPFLLLSFLIIGPYMIDDHLPTLCTMTSYTSRQDGYYSNFYTIVNVNYTVGQGSMLSGVYKTCYSSSPGVRDACVTTLPPSFQCFVEKSYDGSSAPSTNDVLKIDEYFGQKNILVRNIGIGYGSLVFFILSCVSIYLSAEWILDNLILK
jgi:hypothetical protein